MTTRSPTEVRQAELADAALRLIATKGLTALSTRALADEVGLTTGAIFRHFRSLEDLLEAVVARVEVVLDSTFPAAEGTPLERLASFVEERTSAVTDREGIVRLVLSDQLHLALPRRGAERLDACVQKTRVFLVATLREAQDLGEVRDDVTAEALALIVMGTIQALAFSRAMARPRPGDAQATRAALLTLLSTPRSRPRRPGERRAPP